MVAIALMMVSHVPYPVWPKLGLRSWKGLAGIAYSLLVVAAALYVPAMFFFPFGLAYMAFGMARAVFFGLQERLPERDLLRDEDDEDTRPLEDELAPRLLPFRVRKIRRRSGGAS
jgi:hypothetical protein